MKPAVLIPQISVGDIKLGIDAEDYADCQLEDSHSILGVPRYTYSFSETPVVAFTDENKCIESIYCEEECLWRDANLIGMSIANFEKKAGRSHDGEVDHVQLTEQLQDVYEYDDLGLQIWVFDGTIVTIIASDYRD